MKVKSQAEAKTRYGAIENGKWTDESKWMVVVQTPSWFGIQVKNSATGKDTDRIYMNRDMKDAFLQAIQNTVNEGCSDELKTFDGCFMIRSVRGMPTSLSTHAYGLGLDFCAADMPLGSDARFSAKLIKCFTDAGFAWGGNFKRKDPMHFSYGWEG